MRIAIAVRVFRFRACAFNRCFETWTFHAAFFVAATCETSTPKLLSSSLWSALLPAVLCGLPAFSCPRSPGDSVGCGLERQVLCRRPKEANTREENDFSSQREDTSEGHRDVQLFVDTGEQIALLELAHSPQRRIAICRDFGHSGLWYRCDRLNRRGPIQRTI